MEFLTSFFIFVFGAVVGSFLNVCIYRMPRDVSVVRPRSFCPQCKTKIPWHENIPLLSYGLLGGKCSHCKKRIHVRYFIIELASAILWWVLWRQNGFSAEFVMGIVFFSILLAVTVTDFETGLIPDQLMVVGIVTGLLGSICGNQHFPQAVWYQRLFMSLLGFFAGGGILYITGWIGKWIFHKESMGGGDVKLLAMMGSFLGAMAAIGIFLLAPFLALPFALWQRWIKKEETIPFGPFLALAGALFFVHGNIVVNFLLKLYGV